MQLIFWQVYYCNSAISFFDGFRSLPCALPNRRGAPCAPENPFDMALHGRTMCSPTI